MRAVTARRGELVVEDRPDPVPGPGQVLVRPLACGICGSDLHTLHAQAAAPEAVPAMVFGHEFCAEIVDHGPPDPTGATAGPRLRAGTLVCSVPYLDGPRGPELVGLTPNFPGGFAQAMLLQEHRLLPVPAGLAPVHAAVTEPLAVGLHAVAEAGLNPGDVPLVLGCGPIGLAVLAALRQAGHAPVVAADYSAARRALAERQGADVVVDPAEADPFAAWLALAPPPLPPSPLLPPGAGPAPTVVFDCVGAPGLTERIIAAVPIHTRVVVVGVCTSPDSFVPVRAITKELALRYVFAYRPEEFERSLRLIADGSVPVEAWVTGTCDLDGVPAAFADLESPERHCKIIVTPT